MNAGRGVIQNMIMKNSDTVPAFFSGKEYC